tara:strand:- start:102 stop:287 length:186 start_codon:yes stop_codon:yes gene_type:complete
MFGSMKKLIPYLLFSATTLHTFLATAPVMSMACSSHSERNEAVCKDGDTQCQEKISESTTN